MKYFLLVTLFSIIPAFANVLVEEATDGLMSELKGTYQDVDCGSIEYSIDLIDINNDNNKEIFIIKYGTCLSGVTGMRIDLLIKQNEVWNSQFDFPGGYEILKESNLGFPDIMITGRGFCFPIWRWNGKKYYLHRKTCDR